jgi:hypothetical protein
MNSFVALGTLPYFAWRGQKEDEGTKKTGPCSYQKA